jgi:predicted aconitase with swiveling domain
VQAAWLWLGRPLHAPIAAPPLALTAPISFWGGVDPTTGAIIDARHPERGLVITGRVLLLPGTIGSSSASAVLLELVRTGKAPAAIALPQPDAILLLGLIVAAEMGWPAPPALKLDAASQRALAEAEQLSIAPDALITVTFSLGSSRP